MANPYGHRIILHNNKTREATSYCVMGHDTMWDACAELRLQLKLTDPKEHTFQCVGYNAMHNYDKRIDATIEYYYVDEDYDSVP